MQTNYVASNSPTAAWSVVDVCQVTSVDLEVSQDGVGIHILKGLLC